MSLDKLRDEIDQIDGQLIQLLEKRRFLALQALPYKKKVLDPKREEEILRHASSDYLKAIFKQILKSSKEEQTKLIWSSWHIRKKLGYLDKNSFISKAAIFKLFLENIW